MGEVIPFHDIAAQAIDAYGALQDQSELEVLLGILHDRIPEQIIEIGTWAGGLTWALAQLPEVRTVVTVDRNFQPWPQTNAEWPKNHIIRVQGDSTDTYTRDKVTVTLGGELADVLVIDGGHDYHTCMRDWQIYTPLVRDEGLVVVHDTQGFPGNPDVEVPAVWRKIRREHRTLELVSHPGGPFGTGIVWRQ